MAEISAALVMKLRKMSGQGMMDCKKALQDANGDIDEAMMALRKKGLATLEKRAGRETTEGKVLCKISDDGKMVALATLCCETDFVAKSDDFIAAAELLGDYAFACSADEGFENILETEVEGKKFSDVITETVSRIGEKMEVGDYTRFKVGSSCVIGSYVHFNDKVGTIVEIEVSDGSAAERLKQTASDIAMHIVAAKPLAVDRDGIDAEVIEREKAIAADQVKNKPENIIEKIIEGKMNKFFGEHCLLDQPFVKDDKMTIGKVLADAAAKAGGQAKIKRFVRFEIG